MKTAAFNAVCPYEIGDKVKVLKVVKPLPFRTDYIEGTSSITDIACTHFIKTGKILFTYELDGSGEYVPLVRAEEAGYTVTQ
jgi:hypothetical protein